MLEAGVKLIQYREKTFTAREKYRESLAIRALCREHTAFFIVNDDPDLALAVEADGVHVGQDDLPAKAVRRLVGGKMLLGVSAATPSQAEEAAASGVVDYLGVGPVYTTATKKDACAPVGLDFLDYAVRTSGLPVVAIGGITRDNAAEVMRHGAACVAIISDIVGAEDIAARIRAIQTVIAQPRRD
jgi:thiamine-phosphate pyrophosphorylase